MSEPLSLRMKWKLFKMYLKEVSAGTLVNCAYCNSPDVEFDNQKEHDVDGCRIYMSRYTCKRCGATCKNRQEWTLEQSESEHVPDGSASTDTKDLNGTLWRCTDEEMDQYGTVCTVINGKFDPDWNGENEIELEYEDGTTGYMKFRRFCMRFERVL